MGSASGSRPPPKPVKKGTVALSLCASNPDGESNPNPKPDCDLPSVPVVSGGTDAASTAMSIDGEDDDPLAEAEFLSREEVLCRRSRRLKQLNRCYRRQYWALMEEIRVKHRDYYWEFGKSPIEEDTSDTTAGMVFGQPELRHAQAENGSSSRGERKRCAYIGCKSKAMPLTSYCHAHILFDTNQTLYKACRTNNGPQICAKPVLRAAAPSLCPVHFQRANKQISQALKKAGVHMFAYNKPVPKLNVVVSECVRQIQAKRRKMSGKANGDNSTEKNEDLTVCL